MTEAGTGVESEAGSEAGSADDTIADETTAGAGAAVVIGGPDGTAATAATEPEIEPEMGTGIGTVEGTGDEATIRHRQGLTTTTRGRRSVGAGGSESKSAENSVPSPAKPTARAGLAVAALPAAAASAAATTTVKMAMRTTQGMMATASRRESDD